jgi:hypothetical protein
MRAARDRHEGAETIGIRNKSWAFSVKLKSGHAEKHCAVELGFPGWLERVEAV